MSSSTWHPRETHTLEAETELRIEVPYSLLSTSSTSEHCKVRLTSGSAEIFGVELALNRWYDFSCCKIAVYTWHGCTVEVEGVYTVSYESDETACNVAYVNTHAQLEVLRDDALQAIVAAAAGDEPPTATKDASSTTHNNTSNITASSTAGTQTVRGPRVLIAGPTDSGKTSLALSLSTWAAKVSRTPLLVDLDVSCNLWSVPGTLAVAPVTMEATSVTDSVDSANTTPLVYWYGHTEGMANTDLLRVLIAQLASSVKERLRNETDAAAASSGFIVNSMGCFTEGEGYNILLHVMEQMDINVVLVMGHDRLYSMLKSHFSKQQPAQSSATNVKVIKLPRSGGVVSRDSDFRQRLRSNSIRRYFHGEVTPFQPNAVPTTTTANVASSDKEQSQTLVYRFTPNLIELHFDDVEIYKTSQVSLSRGMLPIIGEQRTSKVQLTKVEKSSFAKNMIHSVVAVCQPSTVEAYEKMISASNADDSLYNDDEDDITAKAQELLYRSSVAGFLVIENVDLERQRFSFLSPCSGDLPSRTLLIGDITWME